MRIISWNVNGLRAVAKKGFLEWLATCDGDVVALQEIKAHAEQLPEEVHKPEGWHGRYHPAVRKGYSGVATFTREFLDDERVRAGFGHTHFDEEGRVLATRVGDLVVFNVYFPNGQKGEERLNYKLDFYDALLIHAEERVAAGDKVVVCGDWNTAHREIDLARPKANEKTSGFMPIERERIDHWLDAGWVDAFRHLHPDRADAYSWWSFRSGARERNVGWRLDYHLVSPNLVSAITEAEILTDVMGSDHCPVVLELSL